MPNDAGEYSSEFEYDSETEKKRKKRHDLIDKALPDATEGCLKRLKYTQPSTFSDALDRDLAGTQRFHLLGLDAYSRHKKLINDYLLNLPGSTKLLQRDTSRDQTDLDVIRKNHRFLWNEDVDQSDSWEVQLAKKYYDKLFKEYCIADLRAYKSNKFGMRWRTEKEVVDGKGQFLCGSKHCNSNTGLRSWEVNFAYDEKGERKNALVKLRLCTDCSKKLNYNTRHKEVTSVPATIKSEPLSPGPPHDINADISDKAIMTDRTEEEVRLQEKAIWERPAAVADDSSRDSDFDQYLAGLIL